MKVGIVGLGYVGLPLAVEFGEAGVDVVGIDVSDERTSALMAGDSHIEDVPDARLQAVLNHMSFGTDYAALQEAEAILICVPTPLTVHREPDLGPLFGAVTDLAGVLREGQLVVLESTTYPGTTREELVPRLGAGGLKAGTDFNLAFSPERVDPGREDHTIRNTPKVVGGLTATCTERATAVYTQICDEVVPVSSPEAAELCKLLENIFRSVNIALVNELSVLAHRMKIDLWEVIDAASTKPFGFMRFDPGPGMGGHCLPVDPFYLAWKAREYDFTPEFIELAGKTNQRQPYFCAFRATELLNDAGVAVKGAKVLLLGVAYKPNVSDVRESPSLKITRLLVNREADVSYHDPHVAEIAEFGLSSVDLYPAVEEADLVIVVTAHAGVDHDEVLKRAKRVLDLRGVSRGDVPGVVRL
jgi:UDP-N-acetyl-D-glucosamine dehydrogenase